MQVKVMVIGGGGREHALAWKLAQSPKVSCVFVAPGNAGTAREERVKNVGITDLEALADFALAEKIVLTVVGPEAALAAGAVDIFRARGLRIFGPTRAAAQLESSKSFAKNFMQRHSIPTALHATFEDAAPAHAHVDGMGAPIVVKADGLAAGKGVVVAMNVAEAHAAIDAMLAPPPGGDRVAPAAGGSTQPVAPRAGALQRRVDDQPPARARVVIEEFMAGEEASFIVVSDGTEALALATSQDHKRLLDGDKGPNTGGMGVYSPAPVVTPNVHARVMQEIVWPTLHGMAAEGVPFSGFLYIGLMIDADGRPRTVEFNARLGDPETQAILMRLKSDLFDVLMIATNAIHGAPVAASPHGALPAESSERASLDDLQLAWDRRVALGVVMAASGYPNEARRGDVIGGLDAVTANCKVFHAATAVRGADVVTAGGRVLCVTALGDSVKIAQQHAYDAVRAIHFEGEQHRHDIGHLAIKR